MEKPYFKCILLVLASNENQLYKNFRKIYLEYYNANPKVKVFLVYGETNIDPKECDLIFRDIEEEYYPGMITKTLRAMEYVENNFEYDYILRTNISTFWDFESLLKRLEVEPKEKCLVGTFRKCTYVNTSSPNYISGVDILLSRDYAKMMIENAEEIIDHNLPEDWAITQFFLDSGIQPKSSNPRAIHFLEHFSHFDENMVLKEIEKAKQDNKDHFRIKSPKHREVIDIEIGKVLLREYYGKKIL